MTAYLDLFSGIGGFALGAHWAGLRFDAHYFSEVDPYAIRVYQQRLPDAVPLGDIRAIKGADLPAADWIIAGGFPCQDISVAGKGAGLAGERSGLWYEYARLIGELRPRYAIMENVGALAFRGLDAVLGSLAALGYDAEWQDIRASDVGAPHRRERLWIVGYPCSGGCGGIAWGGAGSESADGHIQLETGNVPDTNNNRLGEPIQPISLGRRNASPDLGSDGEAWSLADATSGGRKQGNALDGGASEGEGAARERGGPPDGNTIRERSRPGDWLPESGIRRVAHGIPSRMDRLKCLGNSIVPQIVELIFAQDAFDEWRIA